MTPTDLRSRREALGLGPVELARRLGVDYSTLFRWERGTKTPSPLLPLALEALERRHADALATELR